MSSGCLHVVFRLTSDCLPDVLQLTFRSRDISALQHWSGRGPKTDCQPEARYRVPSGIDVEDAEEPRTCAGSLAPPFGIAVDQFPNDPFAGAIAPKVNQSVLLIAIEALDRVAQPALGILVGVWK